MAADLFDPNKSSVSSVVDDSGWEIGQAVLGRKVGTIDGKSVGLSVGDSDGKLVWSLFTSSSGSEVGESVSTTRINEWVYATELS